jgi:hypothetical protein
LITSIWVIPSEVLARGVEEAQRVVRERPRCLGLVPIAAFCG